MVFDEEENSMSGSTIDIAAEAAAVVQSQPTKKLRAIAPAPGNISGPSAVVPAANNSGESVRIIRLQGNYHNSNRTGDAAGNGPSEQDVNDDDDDEDEREDTGDSGDQAADESQSTITLASNRTAKTSTAATAASANPSSMARGRWRLVRPVQRPLQLTLNESASAAARDFYRVKKRCLIVKSRIKAQVSNYLPYRAFSSA